MDTKSHPGHCLDKAKIRRCVVSRVATKYHQGLDNSGIHVLHKLAQRLQLIYGMRGHGFSIDDGLVRIPKRVVDGMHEGVNEGWLLIPGEDDACSAMSLQIANDGRDPSIVAFVGNGSRFA